MPWDVQDTCTPAFPLLCLLSIDFWPKYASAEVWLTIPRTLFGLDERRQIDELRFSFTHIDRSMAIQINPHHFS